MTLSILAHSAVFLVPAVVSRGGAPAPLVFVERSGGVVAGKRPAGITPQARVTEGPSSQVPQAGTGSGTMTLSDVMKLGNEPPEYPTEALSRGWEGEVRVRLFVDGTGTVEKVELAGSSGHEVLDASAMRAARGWRLPLDRGMIIVPVVFRLAER